VCLRVLKDTLGPVKPGNAATFHAVAFPTRQVEARATRLGRLRRTYSYELSVWSKSIAATARTLAARMLTFTFGATPVSASDEAEQSILPDPSTPIDAANRKEINHDF